MIDAVEPSITIITCLGDDPDQFESMTLQRRRETSGGWKKFPFKSGRYLDTFLTKATGTDFFVFDSAELLVDEEEQTVKTRLITKPGVTIMIPQLVDLVEVRPEETAQALVEHSGEADFDAVYRSLTSGDWPTTADPAEEAAAFAYYLLKYGRVAVGDLAGVCWEYRGKVET